MYTCIGKSPDGTSLYLPVTQVQSGASTTAGTVHGHLSSVSNAPVGMARRELSDVCQIILENGTIATSYFNMTGAGFYPDETKWEVSTGFYGLHLQMFMQDAFYKKSHIHLSCKSDYSDSHIFVEPMIDPKIKFDSAKDLYTFVEQREDASNKHSG